MAHSISLYNFSKKKNSTKRPSGSAIASYNNVVILNESSILNPVFRISGSNILSCNYFILDNTFYYFIKNITIYRTGVYDIEGEIDSLATYKDEIKASEQYITRCSDSSKFDEQLYDNIISPSSEVGGTVTASSDVANAIFSLGETTTVFGFNGSGGIRSSASVQNFYFTTSASASSVLANVFCTNQNIFDTIVQAFQKISENITMVKVFPFKKGGAMGTEDVYVGEWTVQVPNLRYIGVEDFSTADSNYGRRWGGTLTCSIPAGHFGDYRDYDSNWVDASVEVPMVGNIALPTWALRYSTLTATYAVDLLSGVGECCLTVTGTGMNEKTIGIYNFVAGYDVPISAYVENMGQIVGNMLSFNATGVVGDLLAPPTSFTTLSQASGMANVNLVQMKIEIKWQKSESPHYGSRKGKKTMKKETINTMASGTYIECLNPQLDNTAYADIKDIITAHMEGGFYYE